MSKYIGVLLSSATYAFLTLPSIETVVLNQAETANYEMTIIDRRDTFRLTNS